VKKIIAIVLTLAALAGLWPLAAPPAEAANGSTYMYVPPNDKSIPAARKFTVLYDKFMLDGKEIAIASMSRYEFIHLAEDVATNASRAWEAFDKEIPRPLSDRFKTSKHSVYRFGARDGDVVYLRERGLSGNPAGNWTAIKIQGAMLAMASGNEHMVYMEQPTEFTIKAENPYTSYEYAIKLDGTSASSYLEWIPAGLPGSDLLITGYTVPRSGRYTIIARVSGDTNEANYRDCVGRVYDKVMLDLRSETIALGGVNKREDTVYHVTLKGKKTIYNVPYATDVYISVSKLIGSSPVDVLVEQQLPVETTPDSPASAKQKQLPTTPILIKTIKPRPATEKGLVQKSFVSNDYPENWTVEGDILLGLEYSPNTKTSQNWVKLDRSVGLPLLTYSQQVAKVKASGYLIRSAPDNITMTPASKAKKFNQLKQVKPPSMKPDYKKELIKLKAGMYYYIGPITDNLRLATFRDAALQPMVSISEALDHNYAVFIYVKENGKKSRSAIQTVTLAKRFTAVDFNQGGLLTEKGKVKLQKGFEAFNDAKLRWGSLPKGQNSIQVRQKTTAKYNAKQNTNTGNAASPPVLFQVTYDGKKAITAACRSKGPCGLDVLRVYSGPVGLDTTYTPDIDEYVLGVREGAALPVAFSLKAEGATIEASSNNNISVRVTSDNRVVVSGAKVGDVIDLLAIPANIHEQKTENITLTVGLPFAPRPTSVAWHNVAGEKGAFTVKMGDQATTAADTFEWQLYSVKDGAEEFYKGGSFKGGAGEYQFDNYECAGLIDNYFKVNTRETKVNFRVKVRLVRDKNTPSLYVSSGLLEVDKAVAFGLDVVKFYAEAGTPLYNLQRSDKLILEAYDTLGNVVDMGTGATIQWYRGYTMQTVTEPVGDYGSKIYQISESDDDHYIGVKVGYGGTDRTFMTTGRVGGKGATLLVLNVDNARPIVNAGIAIADFGNYTPAQVEIFGIQGTYGNMTLVMADNSVGADVRYHYDANKLSAAPASWTAWGSGPPESARQKYLYLEITSTNTDTTQRETKYYCFEFIMLPPPTLSLTSNYDPDGRVAEMTVGERISLSVFTDGRAGLTLGFTENQGAGLIAVVYVRNDSVATAQSLTISGGVIDFELFGITAGTALVSVYLYPINDFAGKFSFDNPDTWLGHAATSLTLTIYVNN
jgi:hypothetical protein